MQYLIEVIQREKGLGNYTNAISYLEIALSKYPTNTDLLYTAALLYADIGWFNSSMSFYKKILEIDPTHKDALFDLSAVLFHDGRWDESITLSDTLIKIDPHYKQICMHTANALCMMGKHEEAMKRYIIDLEHRWGDISAWNDMLLSMNYVDMERENRFSFYKKLWETIPNTSTPTINITDKINVGYVSSDFRNHAVSYFTKGVLPNHDKEKFNVYFYHNSNIEDDITDSFKCGGTYRRVLDLSDEQFIQQISEDNIHILVDLNGHTRGNRLSVFLKKPAPIQMSWLGFLNTIGIPQIEHKITNVGMVSEDSSKYYTESLHELKNPLFYSPPSNCPNPSVQPYVINGYVTYGCFNNIRKVTDETIKTWDKILSADKTSRLKLLSSGDFDSKITERFSEENRSRLIFEKECGTTEFMSLISSIDIGLDPFPHSGGATTAHSLWMGVPVVSLKGKSEFENISSSILESLGLSDFICKTKEDYVYCATNLSKERLSKLRFSLRDMFPKSSSNLVGELEKLYREIIR